MMNQNLKFLLEAEPTPTQGTNLAHTPVNVFKFNGDNKHITVNGITYYHEEGSILGINGKTPTVEQLQFAEDIATILDIDRIKKPIMNVIRSMNSTNLKCRIVTALLYNEGEFTKMTRDIEACVWGEKVYVITKNRHKILVSRIDEWTEPELGFSEQDAFLFKHKMDKLIKLNQKNIEKIRSAI